MCSREFGLVNSRSVVCLLTLHELECVMCFCAVNSWMRIAGDWSLQNGQRR